MKSFGLVLSRVTYFLVAATFELVCRQKPDYFIYTHRKGWIHCSEATKDDWAERSGFMVAPLPFDGRFN